MILVRLRCHACRTVLAEISEPAPAWDDMVTWRRCRKCYMPETGAIQSIKRAPGQTSIPLMLQASASSIRKEIERALATGKTQNVAVRDKSTSSD